MSTLLDVVNELDACLDRVDGLALAAGGLSGESERIALQVLLYDFKDRLRPCRETLADIGKLDRQPTGTIAARQEAQS